MRARPNHLALLLAPTLLLSSGALCGEPCWAATGWIPPRPVTALLPSATFGPGSTHSIEMTLRANGAAANLDWTAASGGPFALTVSPLAGSITVPADSVRRVTLSLTVPSTAIGVVSLTVDLMNQIGGGHVAKFSAAITSASDGRPEVWPMPSAWAAAANTAGAVTFQVHSLQGAAEIVALTSGRTNTDPNNSDAIFQGSPPPANVSLPGGGTITVTAPTTIAGSAYGGNANAVQLSVTSSAGISNCVGHALVSAALPESLPTALYPIGLLPMTEPLAGRDGPTELPGRGLWLVPSGLDGVRVMEAGSSLARIGSVDMNANGTDDRLVGQVRIPSFAASVAVVSGFVGPAGDTLDLGLLAAGQAGLMLLDLRSVVDPLFGSWEDFFDRDGNGIDDRILRAIPLSGFATDVAWFRAASGRVVALVADADTGSVPVAASYDPALVAAGTGSGVVAIDVMAAFDSLGSVPYAAGSLATPGSALDLELRGGSSPDLAIADGDAGVAVHHLTVASDAPATVTFTPLGSVTLSSVWGTPYVRDVAWVSNTRDSVYLAVAASVGGVQLVRAPLGGAPSLVLAQQTAAPAIGLAGTWTGNVAAALGSGGVALLRVPAAAELDQIAPAAPAPYIAPVVLSRGQVWTEGLAIEVASHSTPSGSATSLRFLAATGPVPDLLVSDGSRALLLRPGQATIVAVEDPAAPDGGSARRPRWLDRVYPSPAAARLNLEVISTGLPSVIEVFGVDGRLLLSRSYDPLPFGMNRLTLDVGRLPCGVYFVRYQDLKGTAGGLGRFLIVR